MRLTDAVQSVGRAILHRVVSTGATGCTSIVVSSLAVPASDVADSRTLCVALVWRPIVDPTRDFAAAAWDRPGTA